MACECLEKSIIFTRELSSGFLRVKLHALGVFLLRTKESNDIKVASLLLFLVVVVNEFTRQDLLHLCEEGVCIAFVASAATVCNRDHVVCLSVAK